MKYLVVASLALVLGCGGNGSPNTPGGDSDQTDADQPDNDQGDNDSPTDDDNGQCVQGAKRCNAEDGLSTETCQADGSWIITAVCPYVCSGGQCTGECGPGSQRCCRRTASGQKACTGDYLSACIGSDCGQDDPILAVFIETCGTNGIFGETSTCELCATATAACNACSFQIGALCAPAGSGCGDPCQP